MTFDGPQGILNQTVALADKGEGRIGVSLNVAKEDLASVSEGTYSFTLRAQKDGWENGAAATLTVNIKDLSADKCIKVSKKGSIDVLRRSQTCIAYTPKVSNLAGRIIDGRITGGDADKFEAEYDETTGQLCVRARQNKVNDAGEYEMSQYSTKAAYKVTPVFTFETADGRRYEVATAGETIKVTQGKPKTVILSDYGNTLYRQAGNSLTAGIAAELSDENITVSDVTLVNYKKDMECSYNAENQTITLWQYDMKEITKTGKTWNIKLAVRYADKAGNEKDTIVTYKVVIK